MERSQAPRADERDEAKTALIALRRERVASLKLRGLAERQITDALARTGLVNPDTGRPFSVVTVHSDLRFLKKQWQRQAAQSISQHKSGLLAKLKEVEKRIWAEIMRTQKVVDERGEEKDTGIPELRRWKAAVALLHRNLAQQAEVTGANAPIRVQPVGEDGNSPFVLGLKQMPTEDLEAFVNWHERHGHLFAETSRPSAN